MRKVLLLSTLFIFLQTLSAKDRPNIIWLMAEDISLDLACYGMEAVKTPNLDKMAAEGVRFDNCFVTNPICSPSRSAMLVGTHQNKINAHHHRSNRNVALHEDYKPFTYWLRGAGYTCILGHHGVMNKGRKVDANFKHKKIGEWDGKTQFGLFDKYDTFEKEDQPFFAQIQLVATHRGDWWDDVRNKSKHPVNPDEVVMPPYMADHPTVRLDWAKYLDQMEYIDGEVGMIFEELEEKGMADNTVVIFIGDNGRCNIRGKGYLHDPGLHIPFIAYYPTGFDRGQVRKDVVSATDITASILDLADVEVPSYMTGKPILEKKSKRKYVFGARDLWDEIEEKSRALTSGDWKYIRNDKPEIPFEAGQAYLEFYRPAVHVMRQLKAEGKLNENEAFFFNETKPAEELYDLKADPNELTNLSESSKYAKVLTKMQKQLKKQEAAMTPVSDVYEPVHPGAVDVLDWVKQTKPGWHNEMQQGVEIGYKKASAAYKKRPLIHKNPNADWKFKRMEAEGKEGDFQQSIFDDSQWEDVSLPHTAHLEPRLVNDQWQGICWYRKQVEAPAKLKDKKIFLEWEAAMNYAKIWINGTLVAEHHGGYLPIVIDATPYLNFGKQNTIAIRLDNKDNPVTGPKPLRILDFNTYGGLYRKMNVFVKDKIYISHPTLADKVASGGIFITTPKVSEEEAIVSVQTHIVNELAAAQEVKISHTILFADKQVATFQSVTSAIGGQRDVEIKHVIPINQPHLWSPSTPHLYQLRTEVWLDGKKVDEQTNRFGIREFTFKGDDFYINGKKTFLRGVNRHQEYPFIGYALSDNAQYRDVKKIKDAGFDYIRLSHYPQSPALMDACDELGLVVIDAILGWQYYGDNEDFRNYCYRSAKDLIRRDRNHPCVMAWEVSLNETNMPIYFMEKLHEIVHEEYPGENVYSCGWMDDVYDVYLQARQHRIKHKEEHHSHEKPYSVSEYGDWEYYSNNAGLNQHQYNRTVRFEKSSRQLRSYGEARLLQQAYNVQESHNDNYKTEAYSDSYWVMYDYNRGYHDDIESSGIMDLFRIPKFAYYFYQSQRDPSVETVLQIGTYWTPESPTNVKVFSNCDEVELYLNDKLIARQSPDADSNTTHLAHPPFTFNLDKFEAGKLKAVGFVKGEKAAEHKVLSPGKAVALKVWLDESGKKPQAGVNDVLFLYIAAVDANGTIVPDFTDEIGLKLEGDVKVMNVGEVQAEAGIATAVIQIGADAKPIKVLARSNDLKSEVFEFEVEKK